MSKRDKLHQQLEAIVTPVCNVHGVELVEVRYLTEKGGAVVRITIDRERLGAGGDAETLGSGVTLADCTAVSRDVSTALDVHAEDEGGKELISGKFRLEVSSPGIERPLVREKDFVRFAGKEITLRTFAPVGDPPRRKFDGVLVGLERPGDDPDAEPIISIDVDGQTFRVPYEQVTQAKLVYKF